MLHPTETSHPKLPFLSCHQVQQCVPQPEHGSEETGANAAGLQAPAVQGGEIRGEGEDRPRPGQAAPGTEMLVDPKPEREPQGCDPGLGRSFDTHVWMFDTHAKTPWNRMFGKGVFY